MDLTAYVTGQNLVLAGGVFALTQGLKQAFPGFWASTWGQRCLPVVPLVFGVTAMFLGLGEGAVRWSDKALTGVMIGAVAATAFQVGKQTLLGWNLKSDSTTTPAAPTSPPKE
jgi:hypothetical protein